MLLVLKTDACVQVYSSSSSSYAPSNEQNDDVLRLLIETNNIGKRDSVLSKIMKSLWKILFSSDFWQTI